MEPHSPPSSSSAGGQRRKLSLNEGGAPDSSTMERLLRRHGAGGGAESPADSTFLELNQYAHLTAEDGAMTDAEVSALIGQNQYAVQCTDLERDYGAVQILRKLDMNVPVGAIYGLLGPSGCGKTTLMKCILGQLDVHGGMVRAFGQAPGAADHPVPGPAVGYMPQDLALEPEFTVEECVRYHAKLHGMDPEVYRRRKDELLELLDMPPEDRLVRNLSGGQKRRVSLMVALIHRPPLLILDEPTVGIDPLLRSKIWAYLVDLTSHTGCTVIITTHYIAEAEQADMVGFMRAGELLAEGKPRDLMQRHDKDSLEDTFLALCFDQAGGSGMGAGPAEGGGGRALDADVKRTKREGGTAQFNPPPPPAPPRCRVIGALMWKGIQRMRRNAGFIAFQFLVPSIQVILFCLAIGGNPEHVGLAIVNEDAGGARAEALVHGLDAGKSFDVLHRATRDSAVRTVEEGRTWGCVFVPHNFTEASIARYEHHEVNDRTLEQSTVLLKLDATDQQISTFVAERVTVALNVVLNVSSVTNPEELDPVYGERNPKFTDFVAPGIVISIAFSGAIGLTAVSFVVEKKSGLLERAWAAGVRPTEVLLAHVSNMFIILFIQIALLLMFALLIFDLPMEGSLPLAMCMAQLLGLCGMVYGLLISASVDDEEAATQLALSSFFPALLLSGVLWPLQAIPRGLYYISLALPTTWAAEAMRSIMARGWGLLDRRVWIGFAVVSGWTVLLFVCSVRGLKSRKR